MARKTSDTDVLIIGAGPAGMMLALWLARLGIDARIVDKRSDKVFCGQADGFQVRSLEILDSFGVAERIWKESNHMIEVCFWNPDESGRIRRDSSFANVVPGLSRFYEVVLQQGRAEAFFLDAIRDSYGPPGLAEDSKRRIITVERGVMPTSLKIDENSGHDSETDEDERHPVTVTLRHLSEAEATPTQVLSGVRDGLFRSNLQPADGVGDGESGVPEDSLETVRCKYVVGCDGAHSWTRKALGPDFDMEGEMTDYVWGVLDIIPITDFPDIRCRTMIHSADHGSMMIIPRENRLVRLYIQLTEVGSGASSGGRVDRSQIRPELIMTAAKKILHPYRLDYQYCDWWTAYQIGQRVGKHFSKLERVFLAGDAVHTHSPKAGQGMNVSMQDTYNLGWKLGLVCRRVLRRSVLATYEVERRDIAQQLIAFDHRFSRLFSGRPAKDILDATGVSMDEFTAAFRQNHMFTTAIGIRYKPSILVTPGPENADNVTSASSPSTETAALTPGMRFPSHQVVRLADRRVWELQHKMPSDGRFRVVVFGGDVSLSSSSPPPPQIIRINALGAWLADKLLPRLPTLSLMPGAMDQHGGISAGSPSWPALLSPEREPSIVDVLLVVPMAEATTKLGFDLLDLHEVYHPFDSGLGYDYDKAFVDDSSAPTMLGSAYDKYGVDRDRGALVVVRPDGYVGLVTSLDGNGQTEVEHWFKGVLRTKTAA